MKPSAFSLLLLSVLATGSCTPSDDPEPAPQSTADRDVLVQSNGYWEWESSVTLGGSLTPTTVGFTRQLIFKSDSLVHIYHNNQPFAQPTYRLSTGLLSRCGPQQVAVPLVRYIAEPQIPNSEVRTYRVITSPTDTTLSITGEAACVDAGYYERYRWHHR